MRECRFIGLAVPQTSSGKIGAVGRVNHRRTFPIPKRSPAQRRNICDELIESWIDEIDELQLEHWTPAISSETAGDAEDCRFSQRRIENLFWKFSRKFLGEPKHSAFGVFDVFAENHPARIFLQTKAQRLIHCVANSIFSRRQNFVV